MTQQRRNGVAGGQYQEYAFAIFSFNSGQTEKTAKVAKAPIDLIV